MHYRTLMLGLLAPLLAACADDAGDDCTYAVCSILDPSCIEQIAHVVACKRDESVLSPPVRFLTADEVLAEWEAEAEEPSAEELEANRDWLRGLALIGLMPEDYELSDLSADVIRNIWAFYTHDSKEIVVITDRTSANPRDFYLLMVHEMVHAYQDARRDLTAYGETHATTLDRSLGVRALVEGEAVLFTTLADIELAGYHPDDILWGEYFGEWQDKVLRKAAESETPELDVGSLFPYAYGGELVYQAWHRDERGGIDALYADPPDSVRQVMAGHEGWRNGANGVNNEDGALDPHAAPIMPAPYEYLSGGHKSVWLLNATLYHTASGGIWADDALRRVSADYLTVLRRAPGGEVSIIWRVQSGGVFSEGLWGASVWRDEDEGPTSHLVTSVDDDVILVASSGDDADLVWADVQGWTHPDEAFPPDPDDAMHEARLARHPLHR